MDTDLAKDIAKDLSPTTVTIMVLAAFYIFKNIWEMFFKTKDKTDENTQAVRELNINIIHLRDRIVIMESKLDKHEETQRMVRDLKKDYDFLFDKMRTAEKDIEKLQDGSR